MEERNLRKTRVGIVVSDKMDKTITVAIQDNVRHPLYNKIVKKTYKLKKKYREKPEPGSRCLKAVPGSGFSYERRFLWKKLFFSEARPHPHQSHCHRAGFSAG